MTLPPGTRVGPYEIRQPLGAGGMGEVYRARDARLDRDVAIKALPASSLDPDRIARFRREAQMLGALSHPHIAALYGLEETAASQFLVMELVEGGTLSARLERGPLPVRDALTIARQISDALHAAHDRGIIHRDLKPANIAFTSDGHTKVLDFGLAKAFSVASDAPTVGSHATESGVVLGTAAYMSPEQARGLPLDKRSDIFAFGCVLFEMLTARNPFAADTVSDIIVAILGREPDWALLPATIPPRVQWLLRRCLEKDPKRRLHDIADARIELDEALTNSGDSGGIAPVTVSAQSARTRTREVAAWVIAGVALIGAAGAMLMRDRTGAGETSRVLNVVIPLPELPTSVAPEQVTRFAVSPDGTKVVFVGTSPDGRSMLWLRPLDSAVAQPIAGTEGGICPFWSADSRQVGFIWKSSNEITGLSGKLKRVAASGGEPVGVTDVRLSSSSAWNRDGVILFTPAGNAPLHQVLDGGGTPTPVTTLDAASGHVQHAQPSFLPDGQHFLYTSLGSRTGGATTVAGIYVARLGDPTSSQLLVSGASQPSYANGYLLFLLGSALMAQPFDPTTLQLSGSASPITQRLEVSSSGGGVAGAYSASATSILAYQTTLAIRSQLTWFERSGERASTLGEQADWVDVALSPDGSRVALSRADPDSLRDIWLLDVHRALAERFTSAAADDFAPVWSPTGDRVIFSSTREGRVDLFWKSQAAEDEQRIPDGGLALGKFAASWSPDGKSILFIAGGRSIARSDLMVLPVVGGTAEAFADSPLVETQARFSPDGRWVALAMHTSGRLEVYVKPYGRPGNATRISQSGGRWPRWRRDGQELVFLSPDETLMSASIRLASEAVTVDGVKPLFKVRLRPQVRLDAYPYDMTPDAQRFLVNSFAEEPNASSPVTLVINWPELLKK